MSPEKTTREVLRVYRRMADRSTQPDERFLRAQHAVVNRLCGAVAGIVDSDTPTIEAQLLSGGTGPCFAAFLLDEIMLWTPPDGPSVLEELRAQKQLGKRPVVRQFLGGLATAVPRLWNVVDVGEGSWLWVRRHGSDAPPRRVERLDDLLEVNVGDCIVARRILIGKTRVFADGWAPFSGPFAELLKDVEGDALFERAFCMFAVLALGDQKRGKTWLESLREPNAGGGSRDSAGQRHRRVSSSHAPEDPERARLLERIRKLFAMAQQTESSPREAEIALRRCQSLMAKFGITEADLETSEFAIASVGTGRTVATHVKVLGSAVALFHDVMFVVGRGGVAEFCGYEIDVKVASMTFEYLTQAIERALSERKRLGELPPGRSAAFDYRVAFADEVYQRVGVITLEREASERAANPAGTALAVLKRERVDQEFGEDLITKPVRMRSALDSEAADAGREDGQDVSLDPKIT